MTTPALRPTAGDLSARLHLKPEAAPHDAIMAGLYGWSFSTTATDQDQGWSNIPWQQAVKHLHTGIRVRVHCFEETPATENAATAPATGNLRRVRRPAGTTPAEHHLTFHPDGTITLLDHPQATTPHGGHSTHLDTDSEFFLASLGYEQPPCIRTVLWLLASQHDPTTGAVPVVPLGLGPIRYSAERIRSLYAAVAWAQTPEEWPADAWRKVLASGITPRNLAHWVDAGWTVHAALDFLNRSASFDIAQKWRAIGDISPRAALLAGRGQSPEDEQPWLDAGFAPGEADRWRTFSGWNSYNPRPTCAEAFDWHRQGVLPSAVLSFRALAETDEQAVAQSPRRKDSFPKPTRARALAWTAAGVPSDLVLEWHRLLGPDGLAVAARWARYLPARDYGSIATWNSDHPDTPIDPERAYRLHRIGVPFDGDCMGIAAAANLSVHDITRPLNMLEHGKRWLGIEARLVLTAAAHRIYEARRKHRYEDRPPEILNELDPNGQPKRRTKPKEEVLLDRITAGHWPWVANDMRLTWTANPLWKPYLEWLATHPTPPRRRY